MRNAEFRESGQVCPLSCRGGRRRHLARLDEQIGRLESWSELPPPSSLHQWECPIPCDLFCLLSSAFFDLRGSVDLRPRLKRGMVIFCPGLQPGVLGKTCCRCNRSSAKRKLFFQRTLGSGRSWGATLSNSLIFQGTIRIAGISSFEAGFQPGALRWRRFL